MTKRLRILALGMMIVVLLVAFTGCSEQLGSVKDAIMGVKDKVVSILTPYLPACEHEGGEASCTEQAVCVKCGESYGDVLGHDIVVDEAVEPDCENTGLTEGKHCSRCDYTSGAEVVDALGHNVVVDAAVPATCYSTGLTEGKHCDRCGETLVAQTTTTMIPHTYDEEGFDETCNAEGCTHVRTCAHDGEKTVVPGKAPTCTTAGLTDGETCAICGDVTKAQEVIDAIGHDMAEATCTAPATCKRGCGYTVGASKGHSYDNGVVTTAPTCTDKGVKTYTCSACGDSYTEEVKANGHDYAVTVIPSTCIAQGYTNHDCKNCDDSYNDNYTALADHTYDAGVVTTAPTCTEDGEKTYTCTLEGCGHSYTEVVRTEGHATVAHEGKAATCTEDGWEAYVTCENCDYTTYKVITSKGHSGGKATCKSLAVCSACGETYGNYDTVNGHDYGEADCDSPATCKLCGKTSGDAIGHADENKDHKCDRCDAPQGEHVDADSDHGCDYGCSEPIGVCEDANKDHACDYGCGKEYGEHVDTNRDHVCEYGCKEKIGTHSDGSTDTNHTCDYGCTEPVEGEVCVDGNKDHKCDECSANLSSCADTDNDHLCDVCGVTRTQCADKNNDHNCDVCGKKLTDCDDDNGDHYCDLCDEKVSECADTNRDHNCDLCGGVVSECADSNNNHSCDVCGKELSKCADDDNNHKCDLCDEVVSKCADNNKNHYCDICGTEMSKCADGNSDHLCDVCSVALSECSDILTDTDHNCDVCGKADVTEHDYKETTYSATCTKDSYSLLECNCGYSETVTHEGTMIEHGDNNGDFACDGGCDKKYLPDADSTLTVEQALNVGKLFGHNTYTDGKFYVTGTIVEIANTQYGNLYIEDESGNKLYVYGFYGANGTVRYDSLVQKPAVGDKVTIYGIIGTYNGTVQMKNAWIPEHDLTDATCKDKATCNICGATVGDFAEHNYENGKCTVCGASDHECGDNNGDFVCDNANCSEQFPPAADSVLTVEQAIALGKLFEHNTYTEDKYYVTGLITEVYNTQYGNMYITDGTNTLTVYGTYDATGANKYPSMANKPIAGDTVTLYGIIGTYNDVQQMKNGWITEVTPHTCQWSEATCQNPATCSVCGATTGEKAEHNYGNDGVCTNEGCDAVQGVSYTTVTFSMSANGWTNQSKQESFKLDNVVTVSSAGGSNTGKYYTADNSWRIYATDTPAGTVTITLADGYELVSIKITAVTGTYAFLYIDGTTTDICNKTVEVSGSSVLINSVKNGSDGKHVRITEIEVTYQTAGGNSSETPDCAHENTTTNTVDATCAVAGTKTVVCDDCGETVSTETLEATGEHTYVNGVCSVCQYKCTHAGVVAGAVCGVCNYKLPADAPSAPTYVKITSADQLTTGTYVLVVDGYIMTEYNSASSGWVLVEKFDGTGDTIVSDSISTWTLTVSGSNVTLKDANGTFIKPKSGNNNGIQTGSYSWAWSFANGNVTFKGTGSDTTTLAGNTGSGNKIRAYKNATVSGNSTTYPSNFTLYKLVEN